MGGGHVVGVDQDGEQQAIMVSQLAAFQFWDQDDFCAFRDRFGQRRCDDAPVHGHRDPRLDMVLQSGVLGDQCGKHLACGGGFDFNPVRAVCKGFEAAP